MNEPKKKLRVGWFCFTCCEDSTIVMTESMNEHWQEWKKLLDFRSARVLKKNNVLDKMDVAFVEGAITCEKYRQKLLKIRGLAEVVVAVGACAVTGMPSAQRNLFDEKTNQEIKFLLDRFDQLPRVLKIAEVVKVDATLPGCPMDEKQFLELLDKMLKRFKIK